MDSNSHVGNRETNGYVEKNGGIILKLPFHKRSDIPHIGIYKTAETDNRNGGRKRITDGNEPKHQQTPSARKGMVALVEHPQVNQGVEHILMEQRITDTPHETATASQS